MTSPAAAGSAPPIPLPVPRKPGRRFVRHAVRTLVVLGIIAVFVYWVRFARVPVYAHRLATGAVVAETLGTGTLEARVKVAIGPKIAGRISSVLVDEGDHVAPGQVLVRLDDSDLRRQVEVADGMLSAAGAAVRRQEAEGARALAVLDQARYEHERLTTLALQHTASATESGEATKALRVAEAGVTRAEAALSEAQKQLIAAEKTLELHQAKLADTVICAPFAGLIARRDHDPGDVVVPGSSTLLLISTDELWISAWVDETEMARLKAAQPARTVFRAQPGRSYPGEVARLGREVDRETREFVVDVRAQELPENWALGQRAEVYIETDRRPDALTLPASFVVWRAAQPGTFVDDGGRAAWRPLQLGLRGRKVVEVRIALELNGVSGRAACRRALELLKYLGVGERADGYPPELSGGEQQRVAVARALANQPRVILADEPTAALDGPRGRQVMELFRKVAHEQGAAVIVVTHDHRALDVFDVLYEMEDGISRSSPADADGSPPGAVLLKDGRLARRET